MAFRRNIRRKRPSKIVKIFKLLFISCGIFAVCAVAFILYFNGQHVKAPLVKLLSERSGVPISAESVEFSPIYPDTVKLHNVKFSNSTISELYIEYNLKSLLSGDRLFIDDLYIRDANLNSDDVQLLKNGALGFNSIVIGSLRAKNIPLELSNLSAKNASFELNNVTIRKGNNVSISSGSGTLSEGLIHGISYKDLQGSFTTDEQGLYVSDLSLSALGGNISGSLNISNKGEVNFPKLNLERLVLKEPAKIFSKYDFSAEKIYLSDITAVISAKDLLLSGLSGQASNLQVNNGSFSCKYQGDIEEISRPAMLLSLDNNKAEIQCTPEDLEVKLQGDAFQGKYELDALFSLQQQGDTLRTLKLLSPRIELTSDLVKGFLKDSAQRRFALGNIEIENARFLSHLDFLPLSCEKVNANLSGLSWSLQEGFQPAPAGILTASFTDILYADLRINSLSLISNLTDPVIMFSIPKVMFGKSQASAAFSISRNGGRSFLMAQAHDFDLADLNTSMIPYLLAGKINLDADLKTFGQQKDLIENLSGSVKLSSDGLLISNFGLDLINGGKKENYQLDLSQLLTALSDSDCGMHDVQTSLLFADHKASFSGSAKLSTSTFALNGSFMLPSLETKAKAHLVSNPKDSVTLVNISGKLNSPQFTIQALLRGMMRPGLFVKELTPEEQKQYEQQHHQKIEEKNHDTQKLLEAVKVLKEQIAVLEKDTVLPEKQEKDKDRQSEQE